MWAAVPWVPANRPENAVNQTSQSVAAKNPANLSHARTSVSQPVDQAAWRALDYLNLFRLFLAGLFAAVFLSPLLELFEPLYNELLGRVAAITWLVLAPTLMLLTRRERSRYNEQVIAGLSIDLVAILAIMFSLGGVETGVGILLVFTVGAAAILLSLRLSGAVAALATVGVITMTLHEVLSRGVPESMLVQAGLYGLTYFAAAAMGYLVTRRTRETQRIAHQRASDLANMAQLNEIIIQRMRTGILVVDATNRIRLMNEAAWYLLGMPSPRIRTVDRLSKQLVNRLENWRETEEHAPDAMSLGSGVPSVVPRFAKLTDDTEGRMLIFLEDTSIVSRRAEEMTLASLGRLAASIAHEIRNPLGAISHSSQLLGESEHLDQGDRKLIDIISRHCVRMNQIIESVLGLSRRQRAHPQNLVLSEWLEMFLADFKASRDLPDDTLRGSVQPANLMALMDPEQLQQVVWNLCQNALKYGKAEGKPAKVLIRCHRPNLNSSPMLDVIDFGSGISPEEAQNIFQPFYTSSTSGTGLGLYIARQLCESNQATLEYLDDPEGGSCFRITMGAPREAFEPVAEQTGDPATE